MEVALTLHSKGPTDNRLCHLTVQRVTVCGLGIKVVVSTESAGSAMKYMRGRNGEESTGSEAK